MVQPQQALTAGDHCPCQAPVSPSSAPPHGHLHQDRPHATEGQAQQHTSLPYVSVAFTAQTLRQRGWVASRWPQLSPSRACVGSTDDRSPHTPHRAAPI